MPIVVENYTVFEDTASYSSASVNKPTGLANGDVLLFWASQDSSGQTLTGPSGFTLLHTVDTGVGRDMAVWVGYKVITDAGSEPATYTISSTVSETFGVWCARISGVDTTTPIDVTVPTSTDAHNSTSPASVSVTTVTNDALVVRLIASTDNSATAPDQTLTAPASPGGASSYVSPTVSGAGDQVIGAQWFVQATAGATGTDTWTATVSAGIHMQTTVALRPGATAFTETPAFSAGATMAAPAVQGYVAAPAMTVAATLAAPSVLGFSEAPAFTVAATLEAPSELGFGDAPSFSAGATMTVTALFDAEEAPSFSATAALTATSRLDGVVAPAFTAGATLAAPSLYGRADFPAFTASAAMAALLAYSDTPAFGAGATLSITDEEFQFFLTRTSPTTLLTGADTDYSRISWQSTDVVGADIVVDVSYDGSTWHRAANGGPLPSLPGSLSGVTLHVRQVFRSVDGVLWASLDSLHVEVGSPLRIESGSVSYSYTRPGPGETTQASVKRVGSIRVEDPVPDYVDPGTSIFKPYVEMQAPSTGNWVRFYLGEFESLAPPKTDDGTRVTLDLRLASREQKLSRASTTDYVVAPVNRNIVLFVREDVLVTEFGESDFDFPATDDTIPDDIVFPPGTKWIEVVNKALESVGWSNLVVNSEGQWTAEPASVTKAPEWIYPTDTPVVRASSVEPFIGDIPNVVIVRARRGPSLPVEGNGQITLMNLATGPFSIAGRGGLEVTEEIQVEASDQAALERIGMARAESMFRGGGDRLQLTVGLNPLHDEQDSVLITKERFGITDTRFWVMSWAINLGRIDTMATMELTLERHVSGAGTDARTSSAGTATSTATATTAAVAATYADVADDTYACGATSNVQGLVLTP